jgi:hypothetical protein
MRLARALSLILTLSFPMTVAADALDWDDRFSAPGFTGQIFNASVDGGSLYVGGTISSNGNVPMIFYGKWNGSAWEAVADRPPPFEITVAPRYDGQMVATGYTSSWVPDGPYLWNGSAWEIMGEGLEGSGGNIFDWTIFEGELVVAGNFAVSDSSGFTWGAARWDGSSWHGLGGGLGGYGVYALAVYQGDLYAGGQFDTADGAPVQNLARWDGTSWSPVEAVNSLNQQIEEGVQGSHVLAFAEHDGMLAIAGDFGLAGTAPVTNLVMLDATGAQPEWVHPASVADAGLVRTVASLGGELYLGGDLGMVPGATGPGTFARVGPSGWEEIPDAPDGYVRCMITHDSRLHLGGDFERAGGMACASWVTYDGAAFAAQQNPSGLGLSGGANELVDYQGDVVAVGRFASAGSLPAGGIARYDGTSWSALPGGGTTGTIRDAFVDGSDLYVVGDFDEIGSAPAERIARFDGSIWHGHTAPFQDINELTAHYAVAYHDGGLFVGGAGHFDEMQNYSRGHLYRFDGLAWEQLALDLIVTDMVVYDGVLMIGAHKRASSPFADHRWIGYYDGASLAPIFENPGQSPTQSWLRMREIDGLLYIAGEFLKVWDGTQLTDVPTPASVEYPPGFTSGVAVGHIRDIALVGSRTFVASHGDYNGFTVWTFEAGDPKWQVVGGGTFGRPHAMKVFQGSLHLAGWFPIAGMPRSLHRIPGNPRASSGFARYMGEYAVDAPQAGRSALVLAQNRPNPFNPSTVIEFVVPDGGRDVELKIYDARGRIVRRLLGGFHPGGPGDIRWDGRDDEGRSIASGNYRSSPRLFLILAEFRSSNPGRFGDRFLYGCYGQGRSRGAGCSRQLRSGLA